MHDCIGFCSLNLIREKYAYVSQRLSSGWLRLGIGKRIRDAVRPCCRIFTYERGCW
jgi:hypothetical protein